MQNKYNKNAHVYTGYICVSSTLYTQTHTHSNVNKQTTNQSHVTQEYHHPIRQETRQGRAINDTVRFTLRSLVLRNSLPTATAAAAQTSKAQRRQSNRSLCVAVHTCTLASRRSTEYRCNHQRSRVDNNKR